MKLILVLMVIITILLSGCQTNYDELAQCITTNNISMAGTSWCGHCNTQKEMFGNSFQYIDFHDCVEDRQWCINAGIEAYPAWVLADGTIILGVQSISKLTELSNC
ncbi:hypothetical protein HOD61_03295 [archaeon]|jgi:hypothetical protein|nr:hypothetical protein [archaeon]